MACRNDRFRSFVHIVSADGVARAYPARPVYVGEIRLSGFLYSDGPSMPCTCLAGSSHLGRSSLVYGTEAADEFDRLKRRKLARAVGWYWDFIGVIWIVLFVLLGFWQYHGPSTHLSPFKCNVERGKRRSAYVRALFSFSRTRSTSIAPACWGRALSRLFFWSPT